MRVHILYKNRTNRSKGSCGVRCKWVVFYRNYKNLSFKCQFCINIIAVHNKGECGFALKGWPFLTSKIKKNQSWSLSNGFMASHYGFDSSNNRHFCRHFVTIITILKLFSCTHEIYIFLQNLGEFALSHLS